MLRLRQFGLTFAKPNGGMEVARQNVVWTTALCLSYFPIKQAPGRVGSGICKDRLQFENATTEERLREKKRPRLARRRKRRGGKGTAITLWPREFGGTRVEMVVHAVHMIDNNERGETHTTVKLEKLRLNKSTADGLVEQRGEKRHGTQHVALAVGSAKPELAGNGRPITKKANGR